MRRAHFFSTALRLHAYTPFFVVVAVAAYHIDVVRIAFLADDTWWILRGQSALEDPCTLLAPTHGYLRPGNIALFALLQAVFGAQPLPYHLFLLSLHVANTLLLYFLVGRFLRGVSSIAPLLTALWFGATHLSLEGVLFISAVHDTFVLTLCLASLHLLLRGRSAALSLLLFFAAVTVKEIALFFAPAAAVLLLRDEERGRRRAFALIVAAALFAAAHLLFGNLRMADALGGVFPSPGKIAAATVSAAWWGVKTAVGFPGLVLVKDALPPPFSQALIPVATFLLSAALLSGACFLLQRSDLSVVRRRTVLYGLVWYVSFLMSPAIAGQFPHPISRFMYVPSVGLFIVLCVLLDALYERLRGKAALLFLPLLLLAGLAEKTACDFYTQKNFDLSWHRWDIAVRSIAFAESRGVQTVRIHAPGFEEDVFLESLIQVISGKPYRLILLDAPL